MTTIQHRPFSTTGADPVAEAATLLMQHAGVEMWPPSRDEQLHLLRKARSKTHPDRRNGDRSDWDKVEDAAKILDLHHR